MSQKYVSHVTHFNLGLESVLWEILFSESEIPRDVQTENRKYAFFLKVSRAVQSRMKTGPSRLLLFANESLYKCMSGHWIQPDILTQLRCRLSIVRLMRESRQSRQLGQRCDLWLLSKLLYVLAVQTSITQFLRFNYQRRDSTGHLHSGRNPQLH